MNLKIIGIANKLKEQFLDASKELNEISIFLCGSNGIKESKLRRDVGKRISSITSKYVYSVYYPEDMFIELMLGPQRRDLLTLENILADGVNVVAILLQSPGTFTELGAFTNYEKLADKLIIVIDPKYAKKRSFINLGPVRYLKSKTRSKILYIPMDGGKDNLDKLVKQLVSGARDIALHSTPVNDLSNPISSYDFYLALIYIFEPIPKSAIFNIAKLLSSNNEKSSVTAETVLNSLVNERKVFFKSDGGLSTTSKGVESILSNTQRSKKVSLFLTEIRLDALNLTLRRNYKEIWGEVEGF